MNSDIRLQVTFLHHPKIRRLRRELGPDAVLSLLSLWLFTAQNRPHGELRGMDKIDIADTSEWSGKADEFVDCLLRLALLDAKGPLFVIHGWKKNNPFAYHAPARKERAKKGAAAKWAKHKEKEVCLKQKQALLNPAKSNAPSPTPTPTPLEDKTLSSSGDEVGAECYGTKRKRKLSGKRLETFLLFWEAFNYKAGKAPAADSWMDIPELTGKLVDQIILAAKAEAAKRPGMIQAGKTPKMAQGWLTEKRWEDETLTAAEVYIPAMSRLL